MSDAPPNGDDHEPGPAVATIQLDGGELEVLTWQDEAPRRRCLEFRDLDEARRFLFRLELDPTALETLRRAARSCDPGGGINREVPGDPLGPLAANLLRGALRLAWREEPHVTDLARDEEEAPPLDMDGWDDPPPEIKEPVAELLYEDDLAPPELELLYEDELAPPALELLYEDDPGPPALELMVESGDEEPPPPAQ